jgi:hypothetical protein
MSVAIRIHPVRPGRPMMVLLLYGSLLAQVVEFVVYQAAHLPRLVNLFQFAALAGQLAGWAGVHAATRQILDRRRPDEREIAVRDHVGWICFRVLGATIVAGTAGYLVLHDGLGWLPAPGPVALSLLAYTVFILTATLPSAVLAWTHPRPLDTDA